MLWLYLHFPRLALEAGFLGDQRPLPQLLLQPGQHTVLQCNDYARDAGVREGMNKKTAFCLLADCALAEYDPHSEQQALQQLALQCYRHAAQISLQPPSGLLLEAGSMLGVFGGLQPYWESTRTHLQYSGFTWSMSCGATPAMARLLAQAGIELCTQNRTIMLQALDTLTVEQLDLDKTIQTKLMAMGIQTYPQLKALPRQELGFRFGAALVTQLDRLEQDNQPPEQFVLPPRFQQTIHLNYEAEHARGLLFPLKRMLLTLESYLQSRQLLCEKLLIKLEHRDGRASLMTVPSVQGSDRQSDWLALLDTYLEQMTLIDPVTAVTLRAKDFRTRQHDSHDFLGDRFPQADANRMLSLLLARLGEPNVRKLSVQHDPRPEVATGLIDAQQSRHTLNPKHWPSMLWPQPKPIDIRPYRILSGPERIDGGWWDAAPTRRDYYVAERAQASFWVFRRDDGQWFLHGEFL
ncbi:Y-family DNA polymerase [Reinekea blandensis]|uniref:UmuC domain-containing protein n=1 Tax=Reinekea blandensis MED297 TaxID=314283 RepID=A4BIT4_9GAMM|nr:DNA polymerase Y family protein [Reinekea blandensis]EAR07951.1 hypothetical protein MED297_04854 [Reinekea sp. MED297] [Reinekea blandensis MED297]